MAPITYTEAVMMLVDANPRIKFGDTVMGIITFDGERMAFGMRHFEGMEEEYFSEWGTFGPRPINFYPKKTDALRSLIYQIGLLEKNGLIQRLNAIMSASSGVFDFFSEQLIVDNKLVKIDDSIWEGKIKVAGHIYKLLAVNDECIPRHPFRYFPVDRNRQILY